MPTAICPLPSGDGRFDARPMAPEEGEAATLAPWDYTGIYRKDRHQAIGGFDASISESWWQKLDYGMRAWFWGEEIRLHPALRMRYLEDPPAEDASPGPGYRRFYLKNLAVRRLGDSAKLSGKAWRSYLRTSGDSPAGARRERKEIREWVYRNRFRFVKDALDLAETWDWGD